MKDQRFIELVNLYIDRQITAAETAELEAEMQGDPRRRAIYRQYCQLHSATKRVYESFRANGTAVAQAPVTTVRGITRLEIPQRRSGFRWSYLAGGVAAAACLSLVLVRLNLNSPRAGEANLQVSAPVTTAPQVNKAVAPAAQAVVVVAPIPARMVEHPTVAGPGSLRPASVAIQPCSA